MKIFKEKVALTQIEISKRHDQLISTYIQQLTSQRNQLIEEINQFKDKVLKRVETEKGEIEMQFVITESFKNYCQEMMNRGSACDISRMAHDLHARAEELVMTPDKPDCNLNNAEMSFKPSMVTTNTVNNLIGELVLKG